MALNLNNTETFSADDLLDAFSVSNDPVEIEQQFIESIEKWRKVMQL